MQSCIKSIIPSLGESGLIEVFGYSTKGIPGLEIIGLGKRSRTLKEKVVYLTRSLNLKVPPRRFIICLDDDRLIDLDTNSIRKLEMPILLMFWYLANVIPISRLDDCCCSGTFTVRGDVSITPLSDIETSLVHEFKWIGDDVDNNYELKTLPLCEIVSNLGSFNIVTTDKRLNR